jgi:hypothetical protein
VVRTPRASVTKLSQPISDFSLSNYGYELSISVFFVTLRVTPYNRLIASCFSRDSARGLRYIITHCNTRAPVSPLCAAAAFRYAHCLNKLLGEGALVNGLNAPRYIGNPLIAAFAAGHDHIIRILAEHGADFNVCSCDGITGTVMTSIARHSP